MSPPAAIDDAEAEVRILDAADELFYRRGVRAVAMAEVRDAAGVSMRRLYGFSPSKADLVARWLDHRHRRWIDGFREQVDERLAVDDQPIDAVFTALAEWMTATDFRGCGFINTHAESSELTDEQRTLIRNHKLALADLLAELVPGGARLAVLVDGAIVQASIFASTDPITDARVLAAAALHTTTTTTLERHDR